MNTVVSKIALRYLKPSKKEGFISVIAGFSFLGIMLGVATLIIVMSVMNGFREDLFNRILGFNGHIGIYGLQFGGLQNYDQVADRIKSLRQVKSVTPVVEQQSMIMAQGRALGVLVHGIRTEDLKARKLIADNLYMGTLDSFSDEDSIVIGRRMAEKLNTLPGDLIKIVSPEGSATPFGTVPRVRVFKITGIFDAGMKDYDGTVAFIPMTAAQKFYRMPETVTGLEIFLYKPNDVPATTRQLTEMLGPLAKVMSWEQANESFATALQVERNVMFIILTLIILVAAFNIISSLIMLVKEKGRDIAILRTMGATQGMILRIFFLSGSLIGVIGIILGCTLGITFALNIESVRRVIEKLSGTNLFNPEIYFLTQLPSKIDWTEVTTVVLTALGLVFLASIIPAWRAARLDPVEALRYE